MRLLHTSDWHLGKNLEGQSRLAEQEQFLNDFVDMVEEKKIDMVIIAGDIYDTPNPSAKAEQLFYEALEKISKNGERITLVVSGNHDSPDRLVAAEPLARLHGIIIAGTPKTIVPTGRYGKQEVIESGEGYLKIQINGETATVLTVPYPSEKRLNEVLYEEFSEEEERQKTYSERVKLLFSRLEQQFQDDTVNLVVSHLFVNGSKEAGSERSISLGGSYLVDSSCFPEKAQYIALGHVHRPQTIPGTKKRARYSGSPLHFNKREAGFQKKVFVIDVKAGDPAEISEIDLKTYKPIEIWRCNNYAEALEKCKENSERECFVYLEIKTDSFIMEDQIKELREWKKDILEILPVTESDEADVSLEMDRKEQSFEELFTEFYKKERGVEPEEELVSLLLSIVSEDEVEEKDAADTVRD